MTTEQNILKEIEKASYDVEGLDYQKLQAKLSGYQQAQKETAEKVEKLKYEIEDAQEMYARLDWITKEQAIEIIDKIFKETK